MFSGVRGVKGNYMCGGGAPLGYEEQVQGVAGSDECSSACQSEGSGRPVK